MGANPHANGGLLLRKPASSRFPADYAVEVPAPGAVEAQDMLELGGYVRDVLPAQSARNRNFRIFGPDETMSNQSGPRF